MKYHVAKFSFNILFTYLALSKLSTIISVYVSLCYRFESFDLDKIICLFYGLLRVFLFLWGVSNSPTPQKESGLTW